MMSQGKQGTQGTQGKQTQRTIKTQAVYRTTTGTTIPTAVVCDPAGSATYPARVERPLGSTELSTHPHTMLNAAARSLLVVEQHYYTLYLIHEHQHNDTILRSTARATAGGPTRSQNTKRPCKEHTRFTVWGPERSTGRDGTARDRQKTSQKERSTKTTNITNCHLS